MARTTTRTATRMTTRGATRRPPDDTVVAVATRAAEQRTHAHDEHEAAHEPREEHLGAGLELVEHRQRGRDREADD